MYVYVSRYGIMCAYVIGLSIIVFITMRSQVELSLSLSVLVVRSGAVKFAVFFAALY